MTNYRLDFIIKGYKNTYKNNIARECIMKQHLFLLLLSLFLILPGCKQAPEAEEEQALSPDQTEDSERSNRRSRRNRDKDDKKEAKDEDRSKEQAPGKNAEIVTNENLSPDSAVEKQQQNVEIDISVQVNADSDERFTVWECLKGETSLLYVLDEDPLESHLHAGVEKAFLCELYQIVNDEESTSILHAHNISKHCSNRLKLKLKEKQDEGYSCEIVPAEVEVIQAEDS